VLAVNVIVVYFKSGGVAAQRDPNINIVLKSCDALFQEFHGGTAVLSLSITNHNRRSIVIRL